MTLIWEVERKMSAVKRNSVLLSVLYVSPGLQLRYPNQSANNINA